jgi:outer membrane lipopolysaccharide assembly protein LptE/RlpB
VANAVVKQLHQDGTYVVTNSQDADAILTGTVTEVERRPARSVRGNVLQTREFNLYLRVDYKVTDRLSGRVLDSREVSGTTSFFVTGSNNLAADVNQDERQALPIAAEDMAIRLVSQIGEGW